MIITFVFLKFEVELNGLEIKLQIFQTTKHSRKL